MNYTELKRVTKEIYRYPSFYGMEHHKSGIPVVRGEHIDEWGQISTNWSDYWFVSPEVSSQFPRTILEHGDLVFTVRGTIGKVGFVDKLHHGSQLSPNLIKISPASSIEPVYLWYFLQYARDEITGAIQNQVTIASVRASDLGSILIPLPPLPEQQRIAAILSAADEERRRRRYTQSLSDNLLRETFVQMFGDPVTNPMGWEVRNIQQLAQVKTGGTPSREFPQYFGGQIAWVKTTEVVNDVIMATEETLTAEGLENSNCRIFPVDSVIVAMYGQGLTRGRVGKLGIPATTNQACAAIMPSERIVMDYLFWHLIFDYERLRDLGRGGNQPNLNLEMVKTFEVLYPPIDIQNHFATIAAKYQETRHQQQESARQSEHLFQTLLHRAFRGEL